MTLLLLIATAAAATATAAATADIAGAHRLEIPWARSMAAMPQLGRTAGLGNCRPLPAPIRTAAFLAPNTAAALRDSGSSTAGTCCRAPPMPGSALLLLLRGTAAAAPAPRTAGAPPSAAAAAAPAIIAAPAAAAALTAAADSPSTNSIEMECLRCCSWRSCSMSRSDGDRMPAAAAEAADAASALAVMLPVLDVRNSAGFVRDTASGCSSPARTGAGAPSLGTAPALTAASLLLVLLLVVAGAVALLALLLSGTSVEFTRRRLFLRTAAVSSDSWRVNVKRRGAGAGATASEPAVVAPAAAAAPCAAKDCSCCCALPTRGERGLAVNRRCESSACGSELTCSVLLLMPLLFWRECAGPEAGNRTELTRSGDASDASAVTVAAAAAGDIDCSASAAVIAPDSVAGLHWLICSAALTLSS